MTLTVCQAPIPDKGRTQSPLFRLGWHTRQWVLAQTIPLGIFVRAFVRALAQKEIYVVRAFCAGSEFFARTKEISFVRALVRALLHSARTTVFSIVRALLYKCLHNVISFCAGICASACTKRLHNVFTLCAGRFSQSFQAPYSTRLRTHTRLF